jgi:RNA polymerase sigma-B factor
MATTTDTHPTPASQTGISGHQERSERTRDLFEQAVRTSEPAEVERLHEEIVVLNLGVADALAARYARRGLDLDDLSQVARLALVRVVPQFRPEFGRDFLAYAVPSIVGALRKHFRDTGWTVRPPRRVQEAHQQITRCRPELFQRLGREPTVAEVAEETGIDHETVLEAIEVGDCYAPASLDRQVRRGTDESESTLGHFLGGADVEFDRCEARVVLEPLIAALSPRDRRVIELRFFEGLTQSEVGAQIGVTQMQVSRIQSRILAAMRAALGDLGDASGSQVASLGAA